MKTPIESPTLHHSDPKPAYKDIPRHEHAHSTHRAEASQKEIVLKPVVVDHDKPVHHLMFAEQEEHAAKQQHHKAQAH